MSPRVAATAVIMVIVMRMAADMAEGVDLHWPRTIVVGRKSWGSSTKADLEKWVTWVQEHKLHVGDTLRFQYDPTYHNVNQVFNEYAYKNCISDPNRKYWKSGKDDIKLDRPGVHYFFCTFSCSFGMKINATVIP